MSLQTSNEIISTRRPALRMAVLATALMTLAGGFAAVSQAENLTNAPAGSAAPAGQPYCKNPEQMRADRAAFMQRTLDTMANRLEITASQQAVWDEYKKVRMDMMPKHFKRPGPDMNAAQLAQFRAERVQLMAKKMARLSKATSELRAALAPNQQQVLDEMARQHQHKHFGAHGQKTGMQHGSGGMAGRSSPN
ncbi:Spy/CpxP family protein refolding chaperone [Halothiobacillus neapolitanus]|uniref:LTXXQ motif family protein n=1 Tax=Halothiobacillus neapolitanus (strain ATCC 23641 / DSM 15147 / CIP 104769 / NCIMB 8539 / c2) TaxID=555778 RepID=D0L1R2_HALNC|nr:Spy/CpxP family protein refolding chaperone [Halothiobacillus neapolitanus]ACX96635.1 hypothetical protein Hneap_1812 [Halothiobacillus neapolitanus c2]TDN65255.1 hypothetical protein C8D83_102327 [Halothiobacillus neapolitanus]